MTADRHLVVGLGVTGRAVARALIGHGEHVVAVDDHLDQLPEELSRFGLEFHGRPDRELLFRLVEDSTVVLPAPGLPDAHPVFELARASGAEIRSEFDLASEWDDRPIVAITGTDGKTTVTTLVAAMLDRSGIPAAAVGNTDIPLVEATFDPVPEVFVVEASSFRLGHSQRFAPAVACWLNFAPDHLDVHATLEDYEHAKATIWRDQSPEQVAIGNVDDPVVARYLAAAPASKVTFGNDAEYRVEAGYLIGPRGPVIAVDDLPRHFPHDLSNALAATACCVEMGGSLDAAADVLRAFTGLAHRLEFVAEVDGISWYNDSKATVPHATVVAAASFDEVVLIAGGRNKGLDLSEMAQAPSVVAVVAMGEASDAVAAAFEGSVPLARAGSMEEAVRHAESMASSGQAVLLAPGCASFDWYGSYGERGDHFRRLVLALAENESAERDVTRTRGAP